jgi:hypothetical protein
VPSITNLDLDLAFDVANVHIKVSYDITWNSYDQASNQPYRETVRLIGDDTGITPPEDGTDDSIPNGTLSPVFFPVTLQSNGAPTLHRSFAKTIARANLNEDPAGLDEILAVAQLAPVAPAAVRAESNQKTLVA